MKIGPVTKLDKRKKATSKKFDDDVISENYDVIVIIPIYDQLEQSGRRIVKLTFSLAVTFYLTKTENTALTLLVIFCKKMLTSTKLRRPWY